MPRRGAALLCLIASCAACASKPIVEYRDVPVDRPVIVAVPAELTTPVAEPKLSPGPVTNRDLADFIDAWRAALALANKRLSEIAGLAPTEPAE